MREPHVFERRFLKSIEPSHTQHGALYYPVTITLKDGIVLPRAIAMRRSCAAQEFNLEVVGSRIVTPLDVSEVNPSELRLPREIVDRVNEVGETAMNSVAFIARTTSGKHFAYWGPSPMPGDVDFLELPEGFSPAEIESVELIRPPPPSLPAAKSPRPESIALCLY
jgi:hypothetical protein